MRILKRESEVLTIDDLIEALPLALQAEIDVRVTSFLGSRTWCERHGINYETLDGHERAKWVAYQDVVPLKIKKYDYLVKS